MRIDVETSTLITLLLVSARIFAWSLVAPPLATGGLPTSIKTVVSVALALPILPLARAHAPAAEFVPVAGSLVVQIVAGAGLGFLTRLVFAVVESAGGLIDVLGGFSVAAAYDPFMNATNSVFGRFYALLCTTLIFATNVHLVIFQGFLRTFSGVPLDAGFSLGRLDKAIAISATDLFVGALQIAGPLLIVLFIADIALGLLNRIAPQLNVFALSFPVKISLTLMLVGFGFLLMPQVVVQLATKATSMVGAVTA